MKLKPVQWWKNKEDLSKEVAIAIQKQIARGKRPGWVRANKIDIEELQNELIYLNKHIRELEDENKTLKSKINHRIPEIIVTLRVENNEILEAMPYDKIASIESDIRYNYRHIELDEITDEQRKNDILIKEIKEYNLSLPDASELNDYIQDKIVYCGFVEGYGKKIIVDISNDGTCKAKDINISLEFPENLAVEFLQDDNEEPVAPSKLENPLDKLFMTKLGLGVLNSLNETIFSPTIHGSNLFKYPRLPGINSKYEYELENNCIKIWEKDLLHTYHYEIDEYRVMALKPGNYKIKCLIMCEEYTAPVEQIIEFQVI